MTNKLKLGTAIATATLLAASFAPSAFASSTVTVSGNGKSSINQVNLKNKTVNKVSQTNLTGVVNLVGTVQNTGGNKANSNTGAGSVSVTSGNASSTVTNTTTVGGNTATAPSCGCASGDTTVTVSGNGEGSINQVNVTNTSKNSTTQFNGVLVVNGVWTSQNTGGNTANGNTGSGSVMVTSGDATSAVMNDTTVGGNQL